MIFLQINNPEYNHDFPTPIADSTMRNPCILNKNQWYRNYKISHLKGHYNTILFRYDICEVHSRVGIFIFTASDLACVQSDR